MTKLVYSFGEGDKDQKDLLGGKGANLAEMTNLGLPVPPGFTITTEACQAYLRSGHEPPKRANEKTVPGLLETRYPEIHQPLPVPSVNLPMRNGDRSKAGARPMRRSA